MVKKNKKLRIISGAILLCVIILSLFLLFYTDTSGEKISIGNTESVNKLVYYSAIDNDVQIIQPFSGIYTSSSENNFGDYNDGLLSASNIFSISDSVYIKNSIYGSRCSGLFNPTEINFETKKGFLNISYELQAFESGGGTDSADIQVFINGDNIFSDSVSSNGDWANPVEEKKNSKKLLEVEDSDLINIKLSSSRDGCNNGCYALVNISFTKVDQKINIYRFEDDKCKQVEIYESQRTQNDYDTLESCEGNIKPMEFNWDLIIGILVAITFITILIFFFVLKKK